MIEITGKGDFQNTRDFINRMLRGGIFSDLDRYGRLGVEALSKATPVDTGLAARSWTYRIVKDNLHHPGIAWYSTDKIGHTPIVILIQYGHGTGTGGYVQGRDFINPAMRPVFDQIADDVWKKVRA